MQFWQLDVAKHLPRAGPVDCRGLIVGCWNCCQGAVAQDHNKAGPMPDIHHDYHRPSMWHARVSSRMASRHLATCDPDIPVSGFSKLSQSDGIMFQGTKQRQGNDRECDANPEFAFGNTKRNCNAEGDLDGQDRCREQRAAAKAGPESARSR